MCSDYVYWAFWDFAICVRQKSQNNLSLLHWHQSSCTADNKSIRIEKAYLRNALKFSFNVVSSTQISFNILSKSVCDYIILPMEINSKCMHGLIVLAPGVPYPLKLSMSEVFPASRTNYSQPSVIPGAKVITWVSLSWPCDSSSSAWIKAMYMETVWNMRVNWMCDRLDAFTSEYYFSK